MNKMADNMDNSASNDFEGCDEKNTTPKKFSTRAQTCVQKLDDYKQQFIDFMIESNVLKFGEFTLKSGRKSPFFMNAGAYVTGEQLISLGEYYARAIHDNFGDDFNVVFGPAYKGIPLSVITAMAYHNLYGMEVKYCSNRKEVKDHGEGGSLLGHMLQDGDRVVIVEDVTTSGKSIAETYPLISGTADIEVVGLMVSLNRMEVGPGGKKCATDEVSEKYGFPVASIVNMAEVVGYLCGGVGQNSEESAQDSAGSKNDDKKVNKNGSKSGDKKPVRKILDEELISSIDAYYEKYGAKE